MKIFVLLGPGFDASAWSARYRAGETNDLTPYGFHLADRMGAEVSFSKTSNGRLQTSFGPKLARRLRFDVLHAWHNRRAIAASDAVWTMSENEAFAAAALMKLGLLPERPIIGAAIWLFDRWNALPTVNRRIFRALASHVSVLTVHSRASLDVGRRALPNGNVRLSYFGINTDEYRIRPPHDDGEIGDRPIRIFAAGNDRTRDWPTLLDAFGDDPRFELSIWTSQIDEEALRTHRSLRLPKPVRMSDSLRMYLDADIIVVPMVENIFSGITVALEAAALGKPLICSETGGVPTYFTDDEVTYVRPGDAEALRRSALNATQADLTGKAVRAQGTFRAIDYSTDGMIRRYVELTRPLL